MEATAITLDEFKELLGAEAETMTAAELNKLYRVNIAFADFAYKDWKRGKAVDCLRSDDSMEI